MAFANLTIPEQIDTLLPLARELADRYDLGECSIESINHEFNSTFKVTAASGARYALRINVNSQRTLPNLKAEISWVAKLAKVEGLRVATPVKTKSGDYITSIWHDLLGRELFAVMFNWLDGQELGDKPTDEMMRAVGRAMARMHIAAKETQLEAGAELPVVSDMFWGGNNAIAQSTEITDADKQTLARAIRHIETLTEGMYARQEPQLIHADIHGWNVMWQGDDVAIFDFDDCVFGLPAQDLAVTLYYNDTDEQDEALTRGYQEIAPLPEFSESEMFALLLQRRIFLLNYLLETQNPEHRAMVGKYLEETLRRVNKTFERFA